MWKEFIGNRDNTQQYQLTESCENDPHRLCVVFTLQVCVSVSHRTAKSCFMSQNRVLHLPLDICTQAL